MEFGEILHLHSRYGELTLVETLADVVRASYAWFVRSRERHEGWFNPPSVWKDLYDKLEKGLRDENMQLCKAG